MTKPNENEYLSKCCNAETSIFGSETLYHVCKKCKKPCDIYNKPNEKVELKACPCGKIPETLHIQCDDRGKWGFVMGGCCNEWLIEFRNQYAEVPSKETDDKAREAWNNATRPDSGGLDEKEVSSFFMDFMDCEIEYADEFAEKFCAKFSRPQLDVKWPEKKQVVYTTESRLMDLKSGNTKIVNKSIQYEREAEIWNQAIDACKQAYEARGDSSK